MEQFAKRLGLPDQRLDNINSTIGNLVERVTDQPVMMK